MRQINPVTYRLELPASYRITPSFHVSLLKPYYAAQPRDHQPQEPPAPIVIDGAPTYIVKEILDSRRRGGQLQYLIEWDGYSPEERSWEKASDILDPDFSKHLLI